ncbi:MAG: hypothetical protein ACLUIR_01915 [Faecalibacterium prausnitzii]
MAEETRCVLRLYGAPQGRLAAAVARFAPQWRAEAQWKCRGAETLLAVHADTPSGLKKAAQSLRSSFGADVYGAGDTSLAAAAVQALEAHDRLLACGDAAAGALLEARLEKVPGAEKVYDFGTMSYADAKTGPQIEKRARAKLGGEGTSPNPSVWPLPGRRRPAASWEQSWPWPVPSGKATMCWCSAPKKAAGSAPSPPLITLDSGCWIWCAAPLPVCRRPRGQASFPPDRPNRAILRAARRARTPPQRRSILSAFCWRCW